MGEGRGGGLSVSKEVRGRFHAKMLRGVRRREDWTGDSSISNRGLCESLDLSQPIQRNCAPNSGLEVCVAALRRIATFHC